MFYHSFITLEHLEIDHKNIEQENLEIIKSQIKKIHSYKTPKDKLICIINACKLISGMIKHRGFKGSNKEPGADDFLPILIYCVLISRPLKPVSDTIFIRKFRKDEEISGMVDYYLTAYESVFDFFEKINEKKLKIDSSEYEALISYKKKEYLKNILEIENKDELDKVEKVEDDCNIKIEIKQDSNKNELIKNLIFYEDIKDELKFENVSFKSLFVADLKNLFNEYKTVLENYKKMSEVVKSLHN